MRFQFRNHHAHQLPFEIFLRRIHGEEAQIPPLVEKVAVDIDAVGLRQVFGYQLSHCLNVFVFLGAVVADVAEFTFIMYGCGRGRGLSSLLLSGGSILAHCDGRYGVIGRGRIGCKKRQDNGGEGELNSVPFYFLFSVSS